MPRPLRALASGALLVLALPAALLANMADPHHPGDAPGEPSAALAGLVVEHESLRVDLSVSPAAVEAVYTIRNDSASREVDLAFVALGLTEAYDDSLGARLASGEGRYAVTVDGRSVEAEATDSLLVPQVWVNDVATPRIGGGSTRYATPIPPVYGATPEDTLRWAPGFRFCPEIGPASTRSACATPWTSRSTTTPATRARPTSSRTASRPRAAGPASDGWTWRYSARGRRGRQRSGAHARGRPPYGFVPGHSRRPADGLLPRARTSGVRPRERRRVGVARPVSARCALVFGRRQRLKRGAAPRVLVSLGRGALASAAAGIGFAALTLLAVSMATTPYGYGLVFGGILLAVPLFLAGLAVYTVLEQLAGRVLGASPAQVARG